MSEISHPFNVQHITLTNMKFYKKKITYIDINRSTGKESITWSWALPFSSGRGVNSIGLPWDLNCEELCDLFCLAFLTDFRENPSTLSTDGGVVGAEDISLLKRKRHHKHIPKVEAYMWITQTLRFPYTIFMKMRLRDEGSKKNHFRKVVMFNGETWKFGEKQK